MQPGVQLRAMLLDDDEAQKTSPGSWFSAAADALDVRILKPGRQCSAPV
jgi:hypothetical protein